MSSAVVVSNRGAARWVRGHPWIFASDVVRGDADPGIVRVTDDRGKPLGQALWSPRSEIRLRLLERDPTRPIDADWWRTRIAASLARRPPINATAFRVVHGESDGLPSLVVDRYDRWVVAQLLSAGLERHRAEVIEALESLLEPEGILLRNDAAVRRREGLPREVVVAAGTIPEEIEIREGEVRYLVQPRTGQKTGAFLDQRDNRLACAALMRPGGRGLDCFSYHGSFALHLAARAGSVLAIDASADAIARGIRNADLNGFENITWRQADAFEALRDLGRADETFDLVVVDPPAFAKTRAALRGAINGYRDVNLHAMRLVTPGGLLVSASCSFHLRWPDFLAMLGSAAADSGRRVTVISHLTQPADHPEVLSIPESGYLKGAILRVD